MAATLKPGRPLACCVDFLPNRPHLPAGWGHTFLLLLASCAKGASRATLFVEKAEGGSSSCFFYFWEPARTFQSENKPQSPAGAQILPQGWVLTPAHAGLCQRPCTGPNLIVLFKREENKSCGLSLSCPSLGSWTELLSAVKGRPGPGEALWGREWCPRGLHAPHPSAAPCGW